MEKSTLTGDTCRFGLGASCRSFASSSATNHTSYAVDAVSPPTLAVVSCVSDRSDVTLPALTAFGEENGGVHLAEVS